MDVRLLSAVQLRCVRHGSFVASAACVIVPLYPNELTHAAPSLRDTTPCGGIAKLELTLLSRSPISGFTTRSCVLPAAVTAWSTLLILSSPTCPNVASLCPTLAFAAPTKSGVGRPIPCTAATAPASVGSPSAVPVPCASVHPTSAGLAFARPSATRSSVRCADPLGAVRLADRPS